MPRKTAICAAQPASPAGFNEAAARCRGKRAHTYPAAEDREGFNEAAARCRGKRFKFVGRGRGAGPASMRPRPDAAENLLFEVRPHQRRSASMRPRPDAAENAHPGQDLAAGSRASMRPRPDAAENSRGVARSVFGVPRFNEAAARCRGKRNNARSFEGGFDGFNEAAARCRGKLPSTRARRPCSTSLQ